MLIAESFPRSLVNLYGKYVVYSDMENVHGILMHMYLIRTKA